jgi:hypothetical protein
MFQNFPIQDQSQTLLTIAGVLMCLAGWLLFRLGTRVAGMGIGMGLGFGLGNVAASVAKLPPDQAMLAMGAGALIGIIGGLLLVKALTNYLFAITGFLFGALLARLALETYSAMNEQTFVLNSTSSLILLGGSAVGAVLAVMAKKTIMVVVTAYVGTTLLSMAFPVIATSSGYFWAILATSIMWQGFVFERISRPRRKPDHSQKL